MRDLLTAVALLLVIEGLLPVLNPQGLRRALLQMAQLDERVLRTCGLVSMVAGAVLLYIVKH